MSSHKQELSSSTESFADENNAKEEGSSLLCILGVSGVGLVAIAAIILGKVEVVRIRLVGILFVVWLWSFVSSGGGEAFFC